jgi:pescadillo protein
MKITENENFAGKNLFKKLKFFLSREVPRYSLEFVILAFGGEIYWDGDDSNCG